MNDLAVASLTWLMMSCIISFRLDLVLHKWTELILHVLSSLITRTLSRITSIVHFQHFPTKDHINCYLFTSSCTLKIFSSMVSLKAKPLSFNWCWLSWSKLFDTQHLDAVFLDFWKNLTKCLVLHYSRSYVTLVFLVTLWTGAGTT